MPVKTACVVGAGTSGVAALKECVRQGFKTVCYELDSEVGGIWHKKDCSQPANTPSVWDSLASNSSKFNMCFSDFPPSPNDTPYLPAEALCQYFKRVVQHYGLEKYIHFNTRVIKISKTSDHDKTGQWEVFTTKRGDDIAGSDLAGPRGDDQCLSRCHREVFDFVLVCSGYFKKTSDHDKTGQWEVFTTKRGDDIAGSDLAGPRGNDQCLSRCHREVFDFVLVCSGYFKLPVYPDIPGIDKFNGTVEHSFNYHGSKPYEGKTVLVVGNMFSALDVATDISSVSKQVYLAVGKGTWIVPRSFSKARTLDLLFPRYILHSHGVMAKLNDILIREAESKIDHKAIGIRPPRPPLLSSWGINDHLPAKLLSGQVKAYGRLTRVDGDQAQFDNGKIISGVQTIVFATGFKPDLSFVDLDLIAENGKMELYKMVFPLDQKHNTLALIGHLGGDAPLPICFEMQARLVVRVLAGKQKLPSVKKMRKDVEFWNAHAYKRRGTYNSYMVSAFHLQDKIAEEIGCYPSFWRILLKDPLLAFRTYYGPPFSAQYRLLGPDSQWEKAAKVCHALYEEGYTSLRHTEPAEFQRPDVYELYKARTMAILTCSSLTAVASWLLYTFRSQILQHC